jgi:hypothetical protein
MTMKPLYEAPHLTFRIADDRFGASPGTVMDFLRIACRPAHQRFVVVAIRAYRVVSLTPQRHHTSRNR